MGTCKEQLLCTAQEETQTCLYEAQQIGGEC